jgi:hypothetical protein
MLMTCGWFPVTLRLANALYSHFRRLGGSQAAQTSRTSCRLEFVLFLGRVAAGVNPSRTLGDDEPLGIPGHVTGDAEHPRFVAACTHAYPLHRQGTVLRKTCHSHPPH